MISLRQIARLLLVLLLGGLLLLAWDAPQLLNADDLVAILGGHGAALYVLTALTYMAFPTRRRVDLTCLVIFASWAFELRNPSGPYDELTVRMVGDTLGAAAMLLPSYVEQLRALDRSGGEVLERRRWRPAARRTGLLGLPAPARAPFAARDRQK